MKVLIILFLTTMPILLIFLIYSYIRVYSNLKKMIKQRSQYNKISINKDKLQDLYKKITLDIEEDIIYKKDEVKHRN